MNIYIDVGNSRIKWIGDSMSTARVAGTLELLANQWRDLDNASVKSVVGCSVRDESTVAALNTLSLKAFNKKITWQVSVSHACGVSNAYTEPDQLGVDRWAALVAAHARYPGRPCIVVDAGTAVTVDLLDHHGQHRGGVILPGAQSMLNALNRADRLSIDMDGRSSGFAMGATALSTNTHDAVQAGVKFALQGGVNAVISQQVKQISAKIDAIPILLTGGDSAMLNLESMQSLTVPELVLEGLKILNEEAR